MYFVYILRSMKDGLLYTGYTDNLRRRFKEHNQKENKSTKLRAPFTLIYYEACLDKTDAMKREVYLKSSWGKRYLKNRLKNFLTIL